MEEELISKKELLLRYGISYGALYRWKRMGLIPEEWFIKKATPTGQETFFARELICNRIELIKRQKDDLSLGELAKDLMCDGEGEVLIVETSYGRKTFLVKDIKSIFIRDENGKVRNLNI